MRVLPFVLVGLILTVGLVVPLASGKPLPPDDPNCIQIYQRIDLGPVSIVRSGCDTSIEYHGTNCADWKPAWC